jgi:hypothetical protein
MAVNVLESRKSRREGNFGPPTGSHKSRRRQEDSIVRLSVNLDRKGETRLKGGQIRGRDGSRGGQHDLGSELTRDAKGKETRASVLGLDDTNLGRRVRAANGQDVAHLVRRVRRGGSQAQVLVDLVQETNVEGGLGRGSQGGKHGAVRVGSPHVKARQGGLGNRVGSITAHLDAVGHTHASRRANLGHFHDIHDTRGVQAALGIVDAQVGTLAALEGELDIGGHLEGGFQDTGSVRLELTLVEAELGKGVLGANLRREGARLVLFRLNGKGDRSGRLFRLHDEFRRVVIVQEVWWRPK